MEDRRGYDHDQIVARAADDSSSGSTEDRVTLPSDLAVAIARAGVDSTLPCKGLERALRRAIADRRGYAVWDYDDLGWVVTLLSRVSVVFMGATLRDTLN